MYGSIDFGNEYYATDTTTVDAAITYTPDTVTEYVPPGSVTVYPADGNWTWVYPPVDLEENMREQIKKQATELCKEIQEEKRMQDDMKKFRDNVQNPILELDI